MKSTSNKSLELEAIRLSKTYTGDAGFPTILLALFVICLYFFVLFLYVKAIISPLLTIVLLAFITFASYTPMHEAAHGNIAVGFKKLRRLNDVIGYLMAPIIGIPFSSHKMEHLAHHRHTNSDQDPDVHIQHLFQSPKHFILTILRVIKTQNTYFFNYKTCLEIMMNIGLRLVFIFYTELTSIVVLFFGWFLGAFITTFLFSYKPHKPYQDTQRYKNTSIMLFPVKAFEIIMFYQNLHTVHHLFPRVPFYHYRTLYNKIEPALRDNDTPIVNILNDRPV